MKLNQIHPLSPQERAQRLGLDPAAFPRANMSQETEAAVNYIKRKDRSNYKVDHLLIQLHEWRRKEYYRTDAIKQLGTCPDDIERRDLSTLTLE